MSQGKNEKEQKHKFALYIRESSLDIAKELYKKDNCSSISEFIEKAVKFYGGYVSNSMTNEDYVPKVLLLTLKGLMNDTENRHSGSLFRIAVELSMIKNILAVKAGISDISLEKLRGDCVKEVKRINGSISYEEAIRWQT